MLLAHPLVDASLPFLGFAGGMRVEIKGSYPLKVSLLGEMRASVGATIANFPTKKSAALFAILIMNHGRRVTRERLTSILWPDEDEDRARRNLSTSLWRVRRAVAGLDVSINATGDGVELRSQDIDVDLFHFRSLIARARSCEGEDLRGLLELAECAYTGELLEGMPEDWFEDERRVLRVSYAEVLRELANAYIGSGKYGDAVARLQTLVQLDPLDEDAHGELMRAYHLDGRRAAALTQYKLLEGILLTELGSLPTASTTGLYEHIRTQNTWVFPHRDVTLASDSAARGAPFHEIPLIGRGREVTWMSLQLDQAVSGRGSAAIVYGDLGIGKTKLIQAVIEEARLRGFEVLHGTCPDLDTAPPYQVFIQALWPRIRGRSIPPDRVGAVIDQLAESLFSDSGLFGSGKGQAIHGDSALLNEYMLGLVSDRQADLPPSLLVLEDIHRIDGATESLLASLLSRIEALRLFVVLSVRRGERESDRLLTALVAGGAEAVELQPLAKGDIPRFIEGTLGHVVPLPRLSEFVYQRTGGVPLFILEILKFLVAERYLRVRLDGGYALDERALSLENFRVPSRILEIVRRRIGRLEPDAKTLLAIAAVIGSEVPLELLERLLGVPEDKFIETVENLLEGRLLVESDNRFRFPHESIRIAAIGLMSGAKRRKLHERTAALLEVLAPARVGEIAWHYSEAGVATKAALFFEVAGDRAKLLHANEDAARSYSQAVANARLDGESGPQSLRRLAGLLLKRQEVLDLIGDRADQARDIQAILEIAERLGDQSLLGRGLFLRSQVLSRMNQNNEALDLAIEAERLLRAVGDTRGAGMAAESIGLAYVNLRNQKRARLAFNRSLGLFQRARDRAGQARALVNLGMTVALSGDNPGSIRCLDQAEEILRDLGDKRALASALLQKGVVCRCLGQGARSEAMLASGVSLMKEIGDRVGEARGRSQLACTKGANGKLRDALREALRAIALAKEANDVRAQIVFMNNAAYSNFRCIGQFSKAERHVNAAMRMVADGSRPENAAIYYDTMAAILLEKGDNDGALRWGRQALALYRKWQGHFDYVGDDIYYHMGLAYLRKGNIPRALSLLTRSVANWRQNGDLAQLVHGVSAVGELHLDHGELGNALEAAREVEKLLRRVDGLEQIQRVYWIQHRIYAAAGARAAARRALAKAIAVVLEQAETLKGRFRRKFLLDVMVNREVMAAAERYGWAKGNPLNQATQHPRRDPALRIDKRRKAILARMAQGGGRFDRSQVAHELGISTRTLRSDLAALRSEGAIPSSPVIQ